MLAMLKAILEIIVILFALSIVVNIVATKKVLKKATAFCDNEVVIGKPSADLIEKSKNVGAKFYLSSSTLNIYFTGSYRPAICRITLINNVVTAKQIEMAD